MNAFSCFLGSKLGLVVTVLVAAPGAYLLWSHTGHALATATAIRRRRVMNENSNALRPLRLGLSLGTFLLIGVLACLALSLVVPDRGLHQAWLQFLPGFSWTPQGILLGLVEAFAYGLVSGIVYAPIYNWFDVRGG